MKVVLTKDGKATVLASHVDENWALIISELLQNSMGGPDTGASFQPAPECFEPKGAQVVKRCEGVCKPIPS